MHDSSRHDERLTPFEQRLAALTPAARLDRDRLMFEAGRRQGSAGARRIGRWLAAGNALLAAACLALWLAPQRADDSRFASRAFPDSGAPADEKRGMVADVAEPDRTVSWSPVEGPTNLRLMQLLSEDPDAIWLAPVEAAGSASPELSPPPSDARSMLQRYLRAAALL